MIAAAATIVLRVLVMRVSLQSQRCRAPPIGPTLPADEPRRQLFRRARRAPSRSVESAHEEASVRLALIRLATAVVASVGAVLITAELWKPGVIVGAVLAPVVAM